MFDILSNQEEVGEGKPMKLEVKPEDHFGEFSALSRSEAVGQNSTRKSPTPQRLPGPSQ